MENRRKKLELLAPAANAEIAVQAILHGADAIYMGGPSHGARKAASNSLEDIERVVGFAHQYRAKVYVTVNTIIYEDELKAVERLCHDLYRIGVDALIVQDMAVLRMNLPPISLHASTQCDIRTPEKAKFLEDVGFSQLVLARELTLQEIKEITESVTIPVECFVHGALCVSYSGKCHASCAATGRSANRGECAQLCRLPYTLADSSGKIIAKDKYLLSLKDFNATGRLASLIEAGVSSFKIEGRLKDADYVKNVTAHYNNELNRIISRMPQNGFARSSYGKSVVSFSPNPEKSFNRGFTDYFLSERTPAGIASIHSPKSMGEIIKNVRELHNGDGISFFDKQRVYNGALVNRVVDGKIKTAKKVEIPSGAVLHRTNDVEWQKLMSRPTAERKLNLDVSIDPKGVTATDERGVGVRIPLDVTIDKARNAMDYRNEFAKLGNTPYKLSEYHSHLDPLIFIPKSEINKLRRQLVETLDAANESSYPLDLRRKEKMEAIYPLRDLDFKENVANSLARTFYKQHGVESIEDAMEISSGAVPGQVVMTTRHCILRELGMCKKTRRPNFVEPLYLTGGGNRFSLRFDCKRCEMEVEARSERALKH